MARASAAFAERRESAIQRDIVAYLRAVLMPTHRVLAIPNGARRTENGYATNAVAGLTPGASDLLIAGKGHCYFMEIKRARGRLSQDQQCFREWCITSNTPFAVCRSVDDARVALEHWGLETREVTR